MRFSTSTLIAAVLGAAAVSAETFNVLVGKENGLTYDPPTVNAKVGDIISFQFLSKNHTVTQSTFASPCVPKDAGVDSGFQFVPAGADRIPAWSITINDESAPLWFFCNQGPHCKAGMVFAVNPTADKTYDAFKANAAAGGGATSGPNAPTGDAPAQQQPPAAPPAASPAAATSTSLSTPQTVVGASPSVATTLVALVPSPAPANAVDVPAGSILDTDSASQNFELDGSAMTGKGVQRGWMLAGVMGVVALML